MLDTRASQRLRKANTMSANIKFLNAMVSNLSIFDGAGYNRQGEFAQAFLAAACGSAADVEKAVAEYSEVVTELAENLNWISEKAKDRALAYAGLVATWVKKEDRKKMENFIIVMQMMS